MPLIDAEHHMSLTDYAEVANLTMAVQELRTEAARVAERMRGRTVWMVNSTAQGGGVAEMLPAMISTLSELGIAVEWFVMETERQEFFLLTKRLHNLIHGEGTPELTVADRELYETVNQENARLLSSRMGDDDVLVVHDPQPLAMGAQIARERGIPALWRCHIGLEQRNEATRAAWTFLRPYAQPYDHSIFTLPEYIPSYLSGRATIIYPALDPLSHKNRELSLHKLVGVLCDSGLCVAREPTLTPPFEAPALRLQTDGEFAAATEPGDMGLLFRPIIVQISRWDRLKGFAPLMKAFALMKDSLNGDSHFVDDRHRRAVEISRLVIAGPDPASVQDDPEALEVLEELTAEYLALPPDVQRDVALIALPMSSRKHNALMVNALQRVATIVVQNSLHEGFGLTCTEGMWKGVPVMAARRGGLKAQVRDHVDGRLVDDPEDIREVATVLSAMLSDEHHRDDWGRSARRRVQDEFLIFSQIRRWLHVLEQTLIGRESRTMRGQG